ncbi:MAG: fibronectin type III domain-containing protein [Gammaproteobacteria bacterium]|nr:fibronectin type III domain-containing protein [Gammaproteobacteria bacterium]
MKKFIASTTLAIAAAGFASIVSAETWAPTGSVALETIGGMRIHKSIELHCDMSASGTLNGDIARISSMVFSGGPLGLCGAIGAEGLPYNLEATGKNTFALENVKFLLPEGQCFGDLAGELDQATGVITFNFSEVPALPAGGAPCIFYGEMQTTPKASFTLIPAPSALNYPTESPTNGSYEISWPAMAGVSRYELQRQFEEGGWETVYSGAQQVFNEQNLSPGRYRYRLRACDHICGPYYLGHQLEFVLSPPASIQVPSSIMGDRVVITWAESQGVTRYELEQQQDGGSWSKIYSGPATSTQVTNLKQTSSYAFRVRACKGTSCSAYREDGPLIVDPTIAVRKQLYYNAADAVPASKENLAQGIYSRDLAAFRYLDLSYVKDPSSGEVIYRVGNSNDDQDFSALYGPADRTRAGKVLTFTKNLLDGSLANTVRDEAEYQLLNIYHDRALAEMIIANQSLDQARKIRLDAGDIQAEIAAYQQAIGALSAGFDAYSQVLTEHPDILARVSPKRGQISPRYTQQGGGSGEVSNASDLFTGYKEVRLLYDLMNEWGETLYNTIRLTVSAGETDTTTLTQLRADAKELHKLLMATDEAIRAVFSTVELDTLAGFTGVPEAIAQYQGTLSQLANLETWLSGETNLLGLPNDAVFIMFDSDTNSDNFGSIVNSHNPNVGSLAYALQSLDAAKGSYDTFRRSKQSFETDYQDRLFAVNDTLKDLIGWEYNETCDDGPCVTQSDAAVQGSTISLQTKNIEIAQKELEKNEQRLTNLLENIHIEAEAFGEVQGVQDAIGEVIIDYGQEQVKITERITTIREQAERARRKGSLFGSVVRVVAAVYTAGTSEVVLAAAAAASAAADGAQSIHNHNVNIRQIGKEGELNALSQQLAYEERAEIHALNAKIDEINFLARIRSMWLEANVLTLDIALAEANVEMEVERLVGLMNQTNRLLTRAMDLQSGLIDNYFADPIHLKRVNEDLEVAEFAFDLAQEWMFYAVQALEYKWQEPFVGISGLRRDSVFALRNAEALETFYYAMKDFDDKRKLRSFVKNTDSISLKEDILGYYETIRGKPQYYPHPNPEIGVAEMLPAKDAFAAYLRFHLEDFGNEEWIAFNFSTVKNFAGSNFFKGPRILERNGESCVYNGGTYNDKIIDIGVNVLSQSGAFEEETLIELTYGGSSYFRAREVGSVSDILNSIDRFNTLNVRFWDTSGSTFSYTDRYVESFSAAIKEEPSGIVFPSPSFKDRSVAASKWHLAILSSDQFGDFFDIDTVDDIEIVINHQYLSRSAAANTCNLKLNKMPQTLLSFEERLKRDARIHHN